MKIHKLEKEAVAQIIRIELQPEPRVLALINREWKELDCNAITILNGSYITLDSGTLRVASIYGESAIRQAQPERRT